VPGLRDDHRDKRARGTGPQSGWIPFRRVAKASNTEFTEDTEKTTMNIEGTWVFPRIINHKSLATNHQSMLDSLNSKHPNNARHILLRNVIQRTLVFLLELLAKIVSRDIAGFAIAEISA